MAERKVSKTVREDLSGVDFEFHDGAVMEVNVADLPADIVKQLVVHGVSQKIGDSYAGEDAENCMTIAQATLKNLLDGNWSTRTGGGGPRISQLAEALARCTGQEVSACVAKIAEMSDDDKKAVRAHPKVQAALAEIKLEKAQADAAKAAETAGEEGEFDLGSI